MVARTYVALVTPASGPPVCYSVVARDKYDAERRLRECQDVGRLPHPVRVSVKIVNHGPGTRRLWELAESGALDPRGLR